jgi:LPPG:FO 2-phospho-L-lactate transferase
MSNDSVATIVQSDQGELGFQDYFVKRKCEPEVIGFKFDGADAAHPAPGVLESLQAADLVVICPSNPWVSIDPILAVPGIRDAIVKGDETVEVIAISPIIQGKALKGPAAKMFAELGIIPSAVSVAEHYGSIAEGGVISGFVLDDLDHEEELQIKQMGIKTLVRNTIMKTRSDRAKLARQVIEFGESILNNNKN